MHEIFESHYVFVLFVILRSLHFSMLNFICHLFAQSWSRRMSCCSAPVLWLRAG